MKPLVVGLGTLILALVVWTVPSFISQTGSKTDVAAPGAGTPRDSASGGTADSLAGASPTIELPRRGVMPPVRTIGTFVPYWSGLESLSADPADVLYYFGITVNTAGVVTDEPGFAKLDAFVSAAGNRRRHLTVRMLDRDMNAEILQNSDSHERIADSIAATALQYGFDGVVLDLEVGLVSFHIAPASITAFAETVGESLQRENLHFAMTLYGDTFYRKRPYDIKALGKLADEVLIMAYDFHKSFGTPGPNFPLNGREEYGYDFTTMIGDFTRAVPPEKITVIFGMYGYEWYVDDQDRPSKSAEALTLVQAKRRFGTGTNPPGESPRACSQSLCTVRRDPISAEVEARTKTENGRTLVVWYEDDESVRRKRVVMEAAGVENLAYWAYGYY